MSTPLQITTMFDSADAEPANRADAGAMSVAGAPVRSLSCWRVLTTAFAIGWAVTDVGGVDGTAPTPLVFVVSAARSWWRCGQPCALCSRSSGTRFHLARVLRWGRPLTATRPPVTVS